MFEFLANNWTQILSILNALGLIIHSVITKKVGGSNA